MAILIPQQYYVSKGYVDSTMGPYADIAALGEITNLFVGLTVTVLSPQPMECWLPKRALKSGWRIKRIYPVATYSDLMTLSSTIFTDMKALLEKGTEATVTADETNGGKVTKYIITDKTSAGVVWEKQESSGVEISGDDTEI